MSYDDLNIEIKRELMGLFTDSSFSPLKDEKKEQEIIVATENKSLPISLESDQVDKGISNIKEINSILRQIVENLKKNKKF